MLCRNLRLNFEFRSSCFYPKYWGWIFRFVSHVPWSSIISPTTRRCVWELIVIVWSIKFPGYESRIRRCPLLPPGLVARMVWALQCCSAAVLPPVSGALQDRNMLARAASVSALMITSCNVLDENKILLTPEKNGKETYRWGVAEIQKMSPPTTGRCK